MAGTVEGGRKARETNYRNNGRDFYKRIGAIGGKVGTTGGFAANLALAKVAGAKGGRTSRRGPSYQEAYNTNYVKIVSMLKDGFSYKDISREVGIPYSCLLSRLHKEGL